MKRRARPYDSNTDPLSIWETFDGIREKRPGRSAAILRTNPLTGFYRTGCCDTGPDDEGLHLVCAEMTAEFLAFSRSRGNDLSTPFPLFGFPGVRPGDRWCLCAARWKEAFEAGMAPPVILEASHMAALEWVDLDDLKRHAVRTTTG